MSLGNTFYYGYGWYFRGAGLIVGGAAIYIYLRRRNACDLRGAERTGTPSLALSVVGVATYASLYALTNWLGSHAQG